MQWDDLATRFYSIDPEQAALIFPEKIFTYGELFTQIQSFTAILKEKDISVLAIVGNKDFETYVALIACALHKVTFHILPTELSDSQRASRLAGIGISWCFESILSREPLINESGYKTRTPDLKDFMYVLSTSGSTGNAKLVPIRRDQFLHLLKHVFSFLKVTKEDRVSQIFALHFDPALIDIFWTLLNGAALIPFLDCHRWDLFSYIAKNKITLCSTVPSLVLINRRRDPQPIAGANLRLTVFTGENLTSEVVDFWRQFAPKSVIENLYGPVECTVWVSRFPLPSLQAVNPIPIGQAFQGMEFRIDRSVGFESGELLVSGPQVFNGYLNANSDSVFAHINEKVWYRTGDLVTKLENGDYVWIGRVDNQFKVAGQRVQPELIESDIFELLKKRAIYFPIYDSTTSVIIGTGLILLNSLEPGGLLALQSWVKENLRGSLLPKKFYLAPSQILQDNDKLDRKGLIEMAVSGKLEILP